MSFATSGLPPSSQRSAPTRSALKGRNGFSYRKSARVNPSTPDNTGDSKQWRRDTEREINARLASGSQQSQYPYNPNSFPSNDPHFLSQHPPQFSTFPSQHQYQSPYHNHQPPFPAPRSGFHQQWINSTRSPATFSHQQPTFTPSNQTSFAISAQQSQGSWNTPQSSAPFTAPPPYLENPSTSQPGHMSTASYPSSNIPGTFTPLYTIERSRLDPNGLTVTDTTHSISPHQHAINLGARNPDGSLYGAPPTTAPSTEKPSWLKRLFSSSAAPSTSEPELTQEEKDRRASEAYIPVGLHLASQAEAFQQGTQSGMQASQFSNAQSTAPWQSSMQPPSTASTGFGTASSGLAGPGTQFTGQGPYTQQSTQMPQPPFQQYSQPTHSNQSSAPPPAYHQSMTGGGSSIPAGPSNFMSASGGDKNASLHYTEGPDGTIGASIGLRVGQELHGTQLAYDIPKKDGGVRKLVITINRTQGPSEINYNGQSGGSGYYSQHSPYGTQSQFSNQSPYSQYGQQSFGPGQQSYGSGMYGQPQNSYDPSYGQFSQAQSFTSVPAPQLPWKGPGHTDTKTNDFWSKIPDTQSKFDRISQMMDWGGTEWGGFKRVLGEPLGDQYTEQEITERASIIPEVNQYVLSNYDFGPETEESRAKKNKVVAYVASSLLGGASEEQTKSMIKALDPTKTGITRYANDPWGRSDGQSSGHFGQGTASTGPTASVNPYSGTNTTPFGTNAFTNTASTFGPQLPGVQTATNNPWMNNASQGFSTGASEQCRAQLIRHRESYIDNSRGTDGAPTKTEDDYLADDTLRTNHHTWAVMGGDDLSIGAERDQSHKATKNTLSTQYDLSTARDKTTIDKVLRAHVDVLTLRPYGAEDHMRSTVIPTALASGATPRFTADGKPYQRRTWGHTLQDASGTISTIATGLGVLGSASRLVRAVW